MEVISHTSIRLRPAVFSRHAQSIELPLLPVQRRVHHQRHQEPIVQSSLHMQGEPGGSFH